MDTEIVDSTIKNVYAHFLQKCAINSLEPVEVAEAAGVSRQVLAKWAQGDPKTIQLVYSLFNELDRQAKVKRNNYYTERILLGGSCIRTRSGLYVNVFDPKPEMFVISDIARGLSCEYRFGGQTRSLTTVAEHSVRVSAKCSNENRVAGLMHDAFEAYGRDLPSPIKQNFPFYKEIENRVMVAIAAKFGFAWPKPDEVAVADAAELQREWDNFDEQMPEIDQRSAEQLFLDVFKSLTPASPAPALPGREGVGVVGIVAE